MTTTSTRRRWLAPTGLITLSLIPVIVGAARVGQLSGGGQATPEDAHYYATPAPIVVHASAASVYLVLGALQFAPGLRERGWHRLAGRLVLPCGLAAASAALWMILFYPRPAGFGERLEAGFQMVFASAWILFLLLGFAAVRRGNIVRHSAWMTRAYAIGIGAGTQVFTFLPFAVANDHLSQTTGALLLFAGWAINLTVAEWIIRRRTAVRIHRNMIPVMETR